MSSMEAVSKQRKRDLSEATRVTVIEAAPTSGEVSPDQGTQVRVRFGLEGGLVEAFNRATWQEAYELHDTSLRLSYRIGIRRKGALLSSSVGEPVRYVKKASLYWTRNPDLTDNVTNRIWAMVVDEEKVPHVFDSEEELKEFLFTFERRVLVPADVARRVSGQVVAEVAVKWGRHSFVEKGLAKATSLPFALKKSEGFLP